MIRTSRKGDFDTGFIDRWLKNRETDATAKPPIAISLHHCRHLSFRSVRNARGRTQTNR